MPARQWSRLRRRLLEAAGWRCTRCALPGRLEVHHRQPLYRGGTDDQDNLQVLCVTCHVAAHRPPVTPAVQAWIDLL